MKTDGLEIPLQPLLLQPYFEKMIILHYRMMQCIETPDEIARICQNVLVKTHYCEELLLAKRRDSIRELILFAQRQGHFETLINHCESLYSQLEPNKYQIVDAFQKLPDEA